MSKQFHFKQFSSAYLHCLVLFDKTLSGSTTQWTWERRRWRGTPHSLKFQHHWNLTIRLFSVISRTLVGWVLPLCRDAVGVFYSPSRLGKTRRNMWFRPFFLLLRRFRLWRFCDRKILLQKRSMSQRALLILILFKYKYNLCFFSIIWVGVGP